jgi:hypothetical protein
LELVFLVDHKDLSGLESGLVRLKETLLLEEVKPTQNSLMPAFERNLQGVEVEVIFPPDVFEAS